MHKQEEKFKLKAQVPWTTHAHHAIRHATPLHRQNSHKRRVFIRNSRIITIFPISDESRHVRFASPYNHISHGRRVSIWEFAFALSPYFRWVPNLYMRIHSRHLALLTTTDESRHVKLASSQECHTFCTAAQMTSASLHRSSTIYGLLCSSCPNVSKMKSAKDAMTSSHLSAQAGFGTARNTTTRFCVAHLSNDIKAPSVQHSALSSLSTKH